jgi:hypothetical protein
VSRHGAVQSHRVGPAVAAGGVHTMAYQACVTFACSVCGRAITPDELFSRRSRKVALSAMGQLNTVPVCTTCRPLLVEDADGHG